MKWIPIAKAKVKFEQLYLIASPELSRPVCGYLSKSETTAAGVVHQFNADDPASKPVAATYVAIITEPAP